MKIYVCSHCRYLFPARLYPAHCPDCGKRKVRIADQQEIKEYRKFREIINEEIRLGVIPG